MQLALARPCADEPPGKWLTTTLQIFTVPLSVMTYCVALKLNAGLVFLSDSRTNAGLDQISTFRKVMLYEQPGERFMVLQ